MLKQIPRRKDESLADYRLRLVRATPQHFADPQRLLQREVVKNHGKRQARKIAKEMRRLDKVA